MDYLTVHEMAQRWQISERLVQKYCAQGRIAGAQKFGAAWGIPDNAIKPEDLRKLNNLVETDNHTEIMPQEQEYRRLMPLMNTAFRPGTCRESIQRITDSTQQALALAEYYYFSGQPEITTQKIEPYLTSPDLDSRLSAYLLYIFASLSLGQYRRARYTLDALKEMLARGAKSNPNLRAAESFISTTAIVLLHLPLPKELPKIQDFLRTLPPGIRFFALYVQAHYLYLQEAYDKSLGMVEAAFAMGAQDYPIPAIYLHLVAVMDCMSLRQTENAKIHLMEAWALAQPDDLIEGFGEHHGLLGGMLEAVIKPSWPEDFKRIITITYRFSKGWRKIHNHDTGHDVADNLTTTEFAVSMLAARGWTNQEIANHMNISPNTVKRHLSTAMQKLDITKRQELKKYMLQ